MDMLRRNERGLLPYLLIGAIAMGLGWGYRGQFGHERGAMIAGVMTALALAVVSVDPAKRNRIASLGVAGGIGIGIGGVMSYGKITAFVEHPFTEPALFARGIFLLAAKGAIWGGIGGGVFGMAVSSIRYRWHDVLWLIPLFAFWVFTGNVPSWDSLSDGDMSKTLGISLIAFLLWLHVYKQDRTARFFAILTMVCFGTGFPAATLLCKWGETTSISVDWWKVAEVTWGASGGLAWGLGMYLIDQEGEGPRRVPWNGWTTLGLLFCAGVVPLWNGVNALQAWVYEKQGLPETAFVWYAVVCAVFVYVFVSIAITKPVSISATGIATLIYMWVAGSMFAVQVWKMAVPFPWDNGGRWTHYAFLAMFLLSSAYLVYRWRQDSANCAMEERTLFGKTAETS